MYNSLEASSVGTNLFHAALRSVATGGAPVALARLRNRCTTLAMYPMVYQKCAPPLARSLPSFQLTRRRRHLSSVQCLR